MVGDHDPVGGDLAGVHALVERYRNAGLTDVELRVYHARFAAVRDGVAVAAVSWPCTTKPAPASEFARCS